MAKIIIDVSISLDGFATGPNVRSAEPMGDGGERLHEWMAGTGPDGHIDIDARKQIDAAVGAAIVGRRTFDLGLGLWGGTPWSNTPTFVVTQRPQPDLQGDNGGTFAFGDLESSVERAKHAAASKHVLVLGVEVSRTLLRMGLVDELWLHLVPILLGGGTRLFEGEMPKLSLARTPQATSVTHLRFNVGKI